MSAEPYLFQGVVAPERAQISLSFGIAFEHFTSGISADARVSVINNQIAVWVDTEHEWDIFDLRNVTRSILQHHLSMVGYLNGCAYDIDLCRVLNRSRGVDYVFGIDIPVIANRRKFPNPSDLQSALNQLAAKTNGREGIFVQRCFNDLIASMKNADDTAFYCYRAIEALRHHCASIYGLQAESKAKQWAKFREVSGRGEDTLLTIKQAADPLRHGEISAITGADRIEFFETTWDIVDAYLQKV